MIALLLLAAAAAQPAWVLGVDGLGPVKIGMTRAQVAKVLKARLHGAAIESDDICVEKDTNEYPGVHFMFEEKRLTRISVGEPSRIKTARGIGAKASAAQIRRAYGPRLKAEKNRYHQAPAQLLIYWTVPERRGISFETGTDRRAYAIHAGHESITYAEGCA